MKRLDAEHCKPSTIAERLGLDRSYIRGIVNLLRHGEDDLIKRVEAGRLLPINHFIKDYVGRVRTSNEHSLKPTRMVRSVARSCARCNNWLSAARVLSQREVSSRLLPALKPYAHVQSTMHNNSEHSCCRSTLITQRLAILTSSVRRLLADEHFVTLLRAEGLRSLPDFLAVRIASQKEEHLCH